MIQQCAIILLFINLSCYNAEQINWIYERRFRLISAYSCLFPHHNLMNMIIEESECIVRCYRIKNCTHFSWNKLNGGTCWLNTGVVSIKNAVSVSSGMCGIRVSDDNRFPGKTFKQGVSFDNSFSDNDYMKYDYITIWINTIGDKNTTEFDPLYQGIMIEKCKELRNMPMFWSYIIGPEAKIRENIQDCDEDRTNNLCFHGANFIRKNRDHLVSRYSYQAKEIAKALGSTEECVFLIEPNFWQYYGDKNQIDGPLSGEYARNLFDDFVKAIKSELPNARISWDLNASVKLREFEVWWSYFESSKDIDFVHTSGGRGNAETPQFKLGELRWPDFSKITGKKIIADCGLNEDDDCNYWSDYNYKKERISNGVIALSAAKGAMSFPEYQVYEPIE